MTKQRNPKVLMDVQNLQVEYGSKSNRLNALDNINLQIKDGEFVCLLGPSGCGKTTLLNILAGYIKASSGTCTMKGEPITGPDWHRGVVFQSPTLYPWMNVKENVEFGPKMKGICADEMEEISSHFLDQVKLSGLGSKKTFELSGGMKQRVALARVLANYPEVILMDEPFGALDALTRMNMQTLIREIWLENKITIFLITHDIDEALALGTRVLIMSKRPGKIITEYNIDFTYSILNEGSAYIQCREEYFMIKNKILELINDQE